MSDALYVAMTGAKQTLIAQSVNANNLANTKTVGFRADMYNANSVALLGEELPSNVYSVSEKPTPNLSPGGLMTTGRELDVAINGSGYIVVKAPNGEEAMTRTGDFQINANGLLTTGAGHPVMGNGGPIAIPPAEKIQISDDGTIHILPVGAEKTAMATLDRIMLVNPDPKNIIKGEDGLLRDSQGKGYVADSSVKVTTGALESSNVNAVEAMVNMISLARQFEIQMKMMQKIDENENQLAQLMQTNL